MSGLSKGDASKSATSHGVAMSAKKRYSLSFTECAVGLFSRKKTDSQKDQTQAVFPSEPSAAPATQNEPAGGPAVSVVQSAGQTAATQQSISVTNNLLLFGKIMRLLTLSADFRKVALSEIDALVSPAIEVGQVILAETQPPNGQEPRPAAFALWAQVTTDVDRRLSEQVDEPWQLSAEEWRGGDIPWLILAIGDDRVLSEMLKKYSAIRLEGRPFKMRQRGADGKNILTAYPPPDATQTLPGGSSLQ